MPLLAHTVLSSRESWHAGAAEAYFPLSEQFITQIEPAFCGPSCLAMVLNTLRIDPNTTWKGALLRSPVLCAWCT